MANQPENDSGMIKVFGKTLPPQIVGEPSLEFNQARGVWYVKDQGTLTRSAPVKFVHPPATSEFYNKINAHEDVHVRQYTTNSTDLGDSLVKLWDADGLYSKTICNMENADKEVLRLQIKEAIAAQNVADNSAGALYLYDMEEEAFGISNAISPHYLEVDP